MEPAADDIRYMKLALEEARAAATEGEVPIGAVVVGGGRILGRGHNLTQTLNDVTAHAEMIALTAAEQSLGGKYLSGATIYVTVEPCLMCAGALGWSQISRVVYGAPDPKRGFSTFTSRNPYHPKTEVVGGVMAEEAAALMRDFFRPRR